jgi:hypothetical protein
MTRILLHPRLLPQSSGGRVYLPPPWRWWRHKLRRCPDGNMFHQRSDDPTDPTEYSLMFELLENIEIHDPPSMHITTYGPEYDDVRGVEFERTLMVRGETTQCDVVWYQRPGNNWHQLPGTTCYPGDYAISHVDRRQLRQRNVRDEASEESYYSSSLPALQWQLVDTGDLAAEGRRIAAAFGVPGAMVGRPGLGQPGGAHDAANYMNCQCGGRGCYSSRDSFGRIPPAAVPSRRIEDQLSEIMRARSDFMMRNYDQPVAVLMNQEDWEQLRRDALRSEDDLARRALDMSSPMFDRATAGRPFDSIFGMEIRADRNIPRGQVYVMGRNTQRVMNFGDPRREPGDLYGELGALGIMSPNQVRELEGYGYSPAAVRFLAETTAPPRSPDILPESEVVDEIDRLVNESLTPGPRDDYSINRYPKCSHCHHDWHGILCDHCACLGELEDEV